MEPGQLFRETWIAGVRQHFPGTPKPGYITPWADTPEWERLAAAAVEDQVRQFVKISDSYTQHLTRAQKGRWIATCWIAQIHKHIPNPKPSYTADWTVLPEWQQQVDADIFEAIEAEG